MKTFFFFGDSITLGVNDTEIPGGWVSRFSLLAAKEYLLTIPPDTVYNLGVRRHTVRDIAQRWQKEMETRLVLPGLTPCLAFCFGVVDAGVPKGSQGIPVADSVAEARKLLVAAMNVTKEMMLISAPPVADAAHRARIELLNSAYAALCAELTVPYVSLYTPLCDSPVYMNDLRDGLHPGPEGNALFAELLLQSPVMQTILGED